MAKLYEANADRWDDEYPKPETEMVALEMEVNTGTYASAESIVGEIRDSLDWLTPEGGHEAILSMSWRRVPPAPDVKAGSLRSSILRLMEGSWGVRTDTLDAMLLTIRNEIESGGLLDDLADGMYEGFGKAGPVNVTTYKRLPAHLREFYRAGALGTIDVLLGALAGNGKAT